MRVQQYYVTCPECNSTQLTRIKRKLIEKVVHFRHAKLHCSCGKDFYIREKKAA